MHIYCKTKYAVLLAGIPDEKGVLRFPNNGQAYPGICFEPQPLIPISEQLIKAATNHLKQDKPVAIEINHKYSDQVDGEYSIYLATLDSKTFSGDSEWQSMPELLRGMDRSRKRLPFLRAWQVLSGGLELDTTAVENADLSEYLGNKDDES
jgi:hypothetical protein